MNVAADLIRWPLTCGLHCCIALTSAMPMGAAAQAQTVTSISEIGPKRSDHPNPNAASGGRVNKLAIAKADPRLMFAASEWGGLFKSDDAGRTWRHVPGHTPHATWSVKVDPTDSRRIYASSFYDGRTDSRAGISVSTDGGETWVRPATATPPADFCDVPARRSEPSAFGIAIDPANPANVYVGTNCGLAVSNDRGETWRFVDPTPGDGADDIWDVVVHHDGIIDICGDDGHRRLIPGAPVWTTAIVPLPGTGRCSLAVSPDEPNVLFAVVGTTLYETDDGGQTWRVQPYVQPEAKPQGRISFVAVNDRDGAAYDLWYGDVSLFRRSCTTPAAPVPAGTSRCNPAAPWAGGFTRTAGGHDDVGDILFDSAATVDGCPLLFSSDGGIYRNTLAASPGCHSPRWSQPDVTPQAVWNYVMVGVNIPGADAEDLYVGNQDTGAFGTRRGGSLAPGWHVEWCCDIFDVAADTDTVVFVSCCSRDGAGNSIATLRRARPGLTGSTVVALPPTATLQKFKKLPSLISLGSGAYALVATYQRLTPSLRPGPGDPLFSSETAWGVYVTNDILVGRWTQLGDTTTPNFACGLQAASAGGTVSLFVKSGGCDGDRPGSLWRYDGLAAGGIWRQVPPHPAGGFGVYAIDANDPDRILASVLPTPPSQPRMVMTTNGGASWDPLPQLDALMTGDGAFVYRTVRGPRDWTSFGRYPQPSMVAISPRDGRVMVAGAVDSGVFVNFSSGRDGAWRLVTDPENPRTSGIPHIPRPRSAHFEHFGFGLNLYIGS